MYSCTKPLSAGLPRLARLYVHYTPTYNPNFCKITRSDVVIMGLDCWSCICGNAVIVVEDAMPQQPVMNMVRKRSDNKFLLWWCNPRVMQIKDHVIAIIL
ncbi:hypothetical protein LSAT2_027115 [Lamellibrachia satsuma]|nr:hypothetical protein LSAT2_027115 [Lamellibrachia satsuma]